MAAAKLKFDTENYHIDIFDYDGKKLPVRSFENIPYVKNPADPIQILNIYVPECYYQGGKINGYTLKTAPVFLPNTVGGYLPGPAVNVREAPESKTNVIFAALEHGYVVVSPGVRGRGLKDKDGKYTGIAPAVICDLKAAVRFLKSNEGSVPGDVHKIISSGTSAGGAISALLGASGNHPDFAPYLEKMGAAQADDSIFAASCYCPITNLEHADMAYEWEFAGLNDYHNIRYEPPKVLGGDCTWVPVEGQMTAAQQQMAGELKSRFPAYVNSLALKAGDGTSLTLKEDGTGTFQDYIAQKICASAERAEKEGTDFSGRKWIHRGADGIESVDFSGCVQERTRMKDTPAFDKLTLDTPENELFGTPEIRYRHFTIFSADHDTAGSPDSSNPGERLAEKMQIRMMNAMNYIPDEKCLTARHYRIRHGATDRDTSLAVPALLTLLLEKYGVSVDFAYPWGITHSGNYDLPELFAWIDGICAEKA